MRELVGTCTCCNKDIFCLDGFFNGVITDEKEIYCFDCYKIKEKKGENLQS
ncbi:hypothetical protein [Neobacillus massiliamazoniensis]|uniref:Uncharacterized protein n=1 Tax=Neobacillus massiliamazoniensis TaxID=1499688 RepID=A0A0U1P1A7_9BACI|nr:hypothetical protein [Neobacillus massiliamazoniensis]CRK83872.1 hypothetical protein BN000_03867 [Neobacillus massiliamazoniensis]